MATTPDQALDTRGHRGHLLAVASRWPLATMAILAMAKMARKMASGHQMARPGRRTFDVATTILFIVVGAVLIR